MLHAAPSPIVIVHQRVRFLELDVERTVQMLLDEEPEFWSSDAFRNSLQSGEVRTSMRTCVGVVLCIHLFLCMTLSVSEVLCPL